MPLYDFQCQQCQTTFEVRATFKEKEAGLHPECPRCHSPETHQVLTVGLVIIGSQTVATDHSCACGQNATEECCRR